MLACGFAVERLTAAELAAAGVGVWLPCPAVEAPAELRRLPFVGADLLCAELADAEARACNIPFDVFSNACFISALLSKRKLSAAIFSASASRPAPT